VQGRRSAQATITARSIAVWLTVSFLVAACSGPLDVDGLERQLGAAVLPERPELVSSVQCPRPLEPEVGETVRCDALINETPVGIDVTFGANDEVATAVMGARLVDALVIERLVAERFVADLGVATTVRCEAPIVVVPADGAVTCTAIDGSAIERPLRVTLGPGGVLEVALS